MDDIENETQDERRKRLSNLRQKKYYQKNKESITSKFQHDRNDLKRCELKKAQRLERRNNIQQPEAEQEPVPEIAPEIAVRKGRKKKIVYTLEYIKEQM